MGKLDFYRNKIWSCISNIDKILYENGRIDKVSVNSLINLVEAFTVLSNISGKENLIVESESYARRLNLYGSAFEILSKNINEGFFNPFDDCDNSVATIPQSHQQKDDEDTNDIKISNVRLWNDDVSNKIMFKDGKMVAGKYFGKGDIIERCPIRILFEKDMYSENIRKFAFTLDEQRGIYAVPFGYASFYRNSKDIGGDSNSDYEYVIGNTPEESYIKIYSTKPIRKGEEIVLHSDETDFENEIKPGQFKYDNDNSYVSTKKFKML